MKKILTILAIAAVLAACNNGGEEKAATTDSVSAAENPLTDAVNTADSANKIIHDSAGKVMDTMMK